MTMCDYNSRGPRWMPPAPTVTVSPRQRFARKHGMTEASVRELCYLADRIDICGEFQCNGHFHARAKNRRDKNECAALWGEDRDAAIGRLEDLVAPLQMRVWLNGLRPTLYHPLTRQYIEIPQ